MTDAARSNPLVGRVTAFTAACLLVSNMIGTGIFGTTGFMALDLGSPSWILILWAAGALYALLGAFSYGELGAAMPRSGGEYVYIKAAFGPLPGYLSGWTSLTIGFSAAIASSAHLFADHALELLGLAGLLPNDAAGSGSTATAAGTIRIALALGMVWLLTLVHASSLERGGAVQRTLTVVKVGALLALVLGGLAVGTGDWARLAQSDRLVEYSADTLLVAFMFVTFSYTGWNGASYIAGEIRDPQRNLPRAMIWGTLTVGALYMLLNVVYLYALPMSVLAASPTDLVGHKTAMALFGGAIGPWFTALLIVSILGAASAMIWAGPRVYQAMAADGVFPRWFAGSAERSGVPARSILLQSAWVSVLVVTGTFETLVLYATFVLIVFTALAVSSVLVLRRRQPELHRPYRAWAYPCTPLAFLLVSGAILWAALQLRPTESFLGVVTVLAGVPLYFWWRRREPR
jgi:APA family basic amino acid/polyamine antiporter